MPEYRLWRWKPRIYKMPHIVRRWHYWQILDTFELMRKFATIIGVTLIGATAATTILASGAGGIENAKPGSVIIWPAGDGQTLTIVGKRFDPAITIDGSKASFSAISIRDSSGIHIKGGTVIGQGRPSVGVRIQYSSRVTIEGMTVTGAHTGIIAGGSEDVIIKNNQLVGLISDGIQIPLSRRVLIEGNSCADFSPAPKVYDAAGKIVTDGDHADCIQSWSRPKMSPVADIKIINNRMEGQMQGIFLGNKIRNGVDDGGYDRILIEGNRVRVARWHGISVDSARGVTVRNNHISTIPGSFMSTPPYQRISARLAIKGSSDVIACENIVETKTNSFGLEKCPQR